MTWDKLEAIIKARTPAEWVQNPLTPLSVSAGDYWVPASVEDARFIAAMGTLADLMLDVVKAAEGIKRTIDEGFDDRVEESVIDICQKEYLALEAGLAALRAAVDKLPE